MAEVVLLFTVRSGEGLRNGGLTFKKTVTPAHRSAAVGVNLI